MYFKPQSTCFKQLHTASRSSRHKSILALKSNKKVHSNRNKKQTQHQIHYTITNSVFCFHFRCSCAQRHYQSDCSSFRTKNIGTLHWIGAWIGDSETASKFVAICRFCRPFWRGRRVRWGKTAPQKQWKPGHETYKYEAGTGPAGIAKNQHDAGRRGGRRTSTQGKNYRRLPKFCRYFLRLGLLLGLHQVVRGKKRQIVILMSTRYLSYLLKRHQL